MEIKSDNKDLEFMRAAINQARKGMSEGGIPIGSVLVRDGKSQGRGIIGGCNLVIRPRTRKLIV